MTNSPIEHLAALAEIDQLTAQLDRWREDCPPWNAAEAARALVARLQSRVDALRFRLEAPLIVATFGGTGTGKSSLVNALVGSEVSPPGRQRPTTTTPVLITGKNVTPEELGLDASQFHWKQIDAPALQDMVLIDCPDPDTSEAATAGSNLELLREIAPQCDVLIYTSTQQKYRSSRVGQELADMATGCRLLFVQTHADRDSDIREDWKKQLSGHYDVPEMFFVDSPGALARRQAGEPVTGDMGRLLQLLTSELGASQRVEIRRSNLLDLVNEALAWCRSEYDKSMPAVQELRTVLEKQRRQLTETLTAQLRDELLVNRNLWERRLSAAVTDIWGFSPFSAVLRLYNGLGSLIASFTFFRARTSAQMALIGAVQGARWLRSRTKEQEADESLDRIASFGLADNDLQEARISIGGYVRSAGVHNDAVRERDSLEGLRRQAAILEDQFLGQSRRRIDEIIEQLAAANSRWYVRVWYETLWLAFVGFLLYRIGRNFFWDTFIEPIVVDGVAKKELLTVDFYIPALLFLLMWSVVLVLFFTRRLRRGLTNRIQDFARQMAESRLSHGLFPELENACAKIDIDSLQLTALQERTSRLRKTLAAPEGFLGKRTER